MVDKGTNTECVFPPDRSALRRSSTAADSNRPNNQHHQRAILVKRSQTFSPSAAANRAEYICRLNRSDSDSSMPLYRRCGGASGNGGVGSFQRNAVERRSLRWRAAPLAASAAALSCFKSSILSEMASAAGRDSSRTGSTRRRRSSRQQTTPVQLPARTSVDLELDLLAQQKRLQELQEELAKLRELKKRLEDARFLGNRDIPAWLSEDDRLEALLEHVSAFFFFFFCRCSFN